MYNICYTKILFTYIYGMKKEKQITFRVNEEEFEIINKRAEDFKFRSISEYCRFIALNTQQIQIYTGTTLLKYASGGR